MNSIVRRSERKTKTVQYFQRDEGDDVGNFENEDSDWEAAIEETRGPRLDNIDSEASETSCGSMPVTPEKRGHFACSRSPRSPRGRPSPRKRQRKSQPTGQEASQWNLVTDPDIEPQLPRFCPARKPGVQLDSAKKYSYLELFQLFFDHSVVKTLCENTNKNADRMRTLGRKCPWEELTVEEFYRFLGLVIFMGLLKISAFKDYWSHHRVYRVPFCRTVMKRKRFDAIMWTLHLSDPAEDEENRKKRGPQTTIVSSV
ncbi:hypothetical protein GJAV_G00165340 [Gymnothorax javanicus]|nr:hypothetical protein GJAV_G00165340 [Gymnothorax javanicus]